MLAPAEMNPLALELECQSQNVDLARYIHMNSDVLIMKDQLNMGGLIVRLDTHDRWNPKPNWERARAKSQIVMGMLSKVTALLRTDRSPDSLSALLTPSGLASNSRILGWQKRAHDSIVKLLDGLESLDTHALRDSVGNLAGLGLGLTPSGDDFIIGVMHAIWCTTEAEQALVLCSELLATAASKTNALSTNYMTRSASGEASQAWHTLIEAMAQGEAGALKPPVESLIGLGHTSGQDALTGFLLGMRNILQP